MWMVLGLLTAAVETQLPGSFVSVFFALGALAAALSTWLGLTAQLWAQSLVFAGVSAASMLGMRRRLRRRRGPPFQADFDQLVGAEAVVLGALPAGGHGQVELRGVPWHARSVARSDLAAGERCVVTHLDGLTVRVDLPPDSPQSAR